MGNTCGVCGAPREDPEFKYEKILKHECPQRRGKNYF
jgi:hypothetical protein